MVGLIVIGHGNFATGITSSLELIMGMPKDYIPIDFIDTDSKLDLEKKIDLGLNHLDYCDEIIVFVDLFGGTPFNIAMEKRITYSKIRVFYGVNLGMLMTIVSQRNFNSDCSEITKNLVSVAREQIGEFTPDQLEAFENNDDEL